MVTKQTMEQIDQFGDIFRMMMCMERSTTKKYMMNKYDDNFIIIFQHIMPSLHSWQQKRKQSRAETQKIMSYRQVQQKIPANQYQQMENGPTSNSSEQKQQQGSSYSNHHQNNNHNDNEKMNYVELSNFDQNSQRDQSQPIFKLSNRQDQSNKNESSEVQIDDQSSILNSETLYHHQVEFQSGNENQSIGIGKYGAKPNIKVDQNETKKDLDNFKVEFKTIEEYKNQRDLDQKAKNFVKKLQKDKQFFEGKIYLLKVSEHQRRQRKINERTLSIIQQKELDKARRVKQIEKRLQFFQQKSLQRAEFMNRQRAASLRNNLDKKKSKLNELSQNELIKNESASYRIGNRYLQESGRVKKRTKTESSMYMELDEDQRNELDAIRKKIQLLSQSFRR